MAGAWTPASAAKSSGLKYSCALEIVSYVLMALNAHKFRIFDFE